jgi:hypothetical protein
MTETADVPMELEDFLGLKAFRVVREVRDPTLKTRMLVAMEACARALEAVDDVDLAEQELADLETPNVAAWSALAPDVRNVLLAVRKACDFLVAQFPASGSAPSEGDFSFAFEDETSRNEHVDEIVRASNAGETIGEGVRMLVSVLQRDTVALGEKLRNPAVVGDRWFLLAELHQFLGQCAECLEAIVATILGAATSENIADVLPRYLDATARNVMLRSAVVELSHDVDEFNGAIQRAANEDLGILESGLIERLTAFSATPAYKFLKPQDKRAVILARIHLNDWSQQKKSDPSALRNEVEGFAKFLSLMRGLNWRDVLADHDKRTIARVRALLKGGVKLDELVPSLLQVYGCDDVLDRKIRAFRLGTRPTPEELQRAAEAVEARLNAR